MIKPWNEGHDEQIEETYRLLWFSEEQNSRAAKRIALSRLLIARSRQLLASFGSKPPNLAPTFPLRSSGQPRAPRLLACSEKSGKIAPPAAVPPAGNTGTEAGASL